MTKRIPRCYAVDVARGFCLVVMTIDHLPSNIMSRFSNTMFGPFGFFTGASIFVFLSGIVSAWVYGSVLDNHGVVATLCRVLRRALQLYLANTILFLFIFVAILLKVGNVQLLQDDELFLISNEPWSALYQGLFLFYRPGYLDILPMYIVFLLIITPALVMFRAAHGWLVMGLSMLIWLLLQVFSPESHGLNPLGYQVLFVAGLSIGCISNIESKLKLPNMIRIAKVGFSLFLILLVIRFLFGLLFYSGHLIHLTNNSFQDLRSILLLSNVWKSFTHLENNGFLRLANFVFFALTTVYLWPRIPAQLKKSHLIRWLAYLGQHSLPVFIWSVMVVYMSMVLQPASPSYTWRILDIVLCISSLLIPSELDKSRWIHNSMRKYPAAFFRCQ